jgi:hypothetical protein
LIYTFERLPIELKLLATDRLSFVFVTWPCDGSAPDGGPPEVIARVLASAMCAHHHVTFISALADSADATWRRGYGYSAQRQSRLLTRAIPLISTHEPALAMQAFEDEWTTEGHMVLLSQGDAPPIFNALDLQGDASAILAFVEQSADICAALLPGVDGDFAGLYFQDQKRRDIFLEQDLAAACNHAGIMLEQRAAQHFTLP